MSAEPRRANVTKLTLGKPLDDALLVVQFTTREALDDLSKNVAAPWFAEHVRPYLAGPVQRSVGAVVGHVAAAT